MQYLHLTDLINNWLLLFSIVGFPWLHHIKPLADVSIETKGMYFNVGQKRHEGSFVTMETSAYILL
jgi:hypothetical protein